MVRFLTEAMVLVFALGYPVKTSRAQKIQGIMNQATGST